MCDCSVHKKGKCDILELPEWIERTNRTVCVDKCISIIVQELWKHKIYTLGCCCGHNKANPSIVINSSYNDSEIKKIKQVIYNIDKREWDIQQWRLIKV